MADVTVEEVREQLAALGYKGAVPDTVLQAFLDDIKRQSDSALDMYEDEDSPAAPAAAATAVDATTPEEAEPQRAAVVVVPAPAAVAATGADADDDDDGADLIGAAALELGMDADAENANPAPEAPAAAPAAPAAPTGVAPAPGNVPPLPVAQMSRPRTAPGSAGRRMTGKASRGSPAPGSARARSAMSPASAAPGTKHTRTTPDDARRTRQRRHELEEHHEADIGTEGVALGLPGFIKVRNVNASPGFKRGGKVKHDPVSAYARMQKLWASDKRRKGGAGSRRKAAAAVGATGPSEPVRRRPKTAPVAGGASYVPPDQKRRDRLRLQVRARMLMYQVDAAATPRKGRMLMPSDYKGPGHDGRRDVRWETRSRLMSTAR